jgi:hypothetical protein
MTLRELIEQLPHGTEIVKNKYLWKVQLKNKFTNHQLIAVYDEDLYQAITKMIERLKK